MAQKFAAEGSNIAINYMSNKEAADSVASNIASKYNVKTIVVQGVCFSGLLGLLRTGIADVAIVVFYRTQEARVTVPMLSRLPLINWEVWMS